MAHNVKEKGIKNQKCKSKDVNISRNEKISNQSSVLNYLTRQTSTQSSFNESFTSTSSFDSARNGTLIELPQMISVIESRRKSLEEREKEIESINDEKIKKVLLNLLGDVKNVFDDNEKIVQSHNELLRKQIDDSEEIQSNSRSINNLNKGVGNLADGLDVIRNRVQSLEVANNCAYDSTFLNITFVNEREADSLESCSASPREKFTEILSDMKIVSPKDITDAHLMSARRFQNGRRRQIKILRVRFNDSITAGRIFSQVIKHNKCLSDAGRSDAIKYFAEMPASKNVWNLKKICFELRNEGTFINVRGSERGILVSYKIKDPNDQSKDVVKTSVVTSVKDIDYLRKDLNVNDAYISVSKKYDEDYWSKKVKPGSTQKRLRELDENEDIVDPKRPSSSNQ